MRLEERRPRDYVIERWKRLEPSYSMRVNKVKKIKINKQPLRALSIGDATLRFFSLKSLSIVILVCQP